MKRIIPVSGCLLMALAAAPADAAIMVVGNSVGYGCYSSAEAKDGSRPALEDCNNAFKSGLLSASDQVATYVNRGIVKLWGKDYDGAIADFDKAIELDPDQAESYLNKGSVILRMEGNTAEAISNFDEALARKTKRPEYAYYGRAIAYEISGNLNAAYRDYRRAQQAAPKWDDPREELSRFQVKRISSNM